MKMKHMRLICLAMLTVTLGAPAPAQQIPSRVDIAWNRYYDYDETTELLRKLVDAYPELLSLQSLGRSEQGREMWLVTLNNPATGTDTEKPAMWIDGNIHGNEVQATETVVYSIWYLTKSYGKVAQLTELIDRTAFYFLPMVNPDGRDFWFDQANTSSTSRSGQRPTDNDYDGMLDEDGPEDLDGDGHITSMWRFDPNGQYRRNEVDPRIIERVPEGVTGELSRAGSEGIDNDGDGRINEDGPGGYDMNRNWPTDWQPNYIQYGAGDYPFDRPETRAAGAFILNHPNIAAGQTYHNMGGMILRGPGADYLSSTYTSADRRVYDALGEAGEDLLPFYGYMILWDDLYTVHGGSLNWMAEGLGIVTFSNELWTGDRMMPDPTREFDENERMHWQDRIMFGQTFTDYTEHDHPTLGKVLIGGNTKYASRNTPPFMLEEGCHRNFAFTMFHADNMPLLSFKWVATKELRPGLFEVTVEIENEKIISSRMPIAARNKIGMPDELRLTGAEVVMGGTVADRLDKTIDPVKHQPHILRVEDGIPGKSVKTFRFLVEGAAGSVITLKYTAEKARDITRTVPLGFLEL